MAPARIAHIDPDTELSRSITEYLEPHGIRVHSFPEDQNGIGQVEKLDPDLILLELDLPDIDGIDVCRQLRMVTDTPIIVASQRRQETDTVLGLEVGADDFVAKPFSFRELLARIGAHIRRAQGRTGPARVIHAGPLRIDTAGVHASLKDQELALTTYEFRLLRVLAERAGQVMRREQLVDLVRGGSDESLDRSIDVHICRLRQKLGDDPRRPQVLRTVRGVGYVLLTNPAVVEASSAAAPVVS